MDPDEAFLQDPQCLLVLHSDFLEIISWLLASIQCQAHRTLQQPQPEAASNSELQSVSQRRPQQHVEQRFQFLNFVRPELDLATTDFRPPLLLLRRVCALMPIDIDERSSWISPLVQAKRCLVSPGECTVHPRCQQFQHYFAHLFECGIFCRHPFTCFCSKEYLRQLGQWPSSRPQ